ncbi:MAG: FmdB family zinc ribbon protein, partial [Gemmatimonadota bacterium]
MPTYEYRCTNGHGFEDFVLKMSDAKFQIPCPTCGERGERQLSAGGGLVFKGSGFYITDYGKDGKKPSA